MRTVSLREADHKDETLLLRWRNDAEAVKWSATPTKVSEEEHHNWFTKALRSELTGIYIGVADMVPVGVIRFDTIKTEDGDKIFISITVAPECRGKGFGKILLTAGCLMMRDYNLNAIISAKNEKSISIFTKCGFAENGKFSSPGFLIFSRGPLLI